MSAQLFNSLLELGSEGLGRLTDRELFTLNQLLKEEQYDKLDARCSRAIVDEREFASTDCGPLYWLQNLTKTVDDHALAKRTPAKAPFPRKTYFQPLMGELLRPVLHPSPECYVTFFPKSREMMTSWAICGYIGWVCQWRPGTLAVVQTLKETKAEELVRYVSILTENQEPFLRAHHAIKRSVALEIEWQNGSRIFGIPGGENQIRMFHPMIVVFDEMAFMERRGGLPQCREARCKANYRRQFGSPWMDGGRMHTLRLYCRLREPLQGWCKVSMEEAREKLISVRHYCFVRGVLRGTPDSQAGRDEDFRQAFRTLNRLYVERKRSLERHLNVYGRSATQRKQSVSRAA